MSQVAFPKLITSRTAFAIARVILDGVGMHCRLLRHARQGAKRHVLHHIVMPAAHKQPRRFPDSASDSFLSAAKQPPHGEHAVLFFGEPES